MVDMIERYGVGCIYSGVMRGGKIPWIHVYGHMNNQKLKHLVDIEYSSLGM